MSRGGTGLAGGMIGEWECTAFLNVAVLAFPLEQSYVRKDHDTAGKGSWVGLARGGKG